MYYTPEKYQAGLDHVVLLEVILATENMIVESLLVSPPLVDQVESIVDVPSKTCVDHLNVRAVVLVRSGLGATVDEKPGVTQTSSHWAAAPGQVIPQPFKRVQSLERVDRKAFRVL